MNGQRAFMSAAIAAGLAVAPLYTVDRSLPHVEGEPTALVALGDDGLVYGGSNPHEAGEPWFLVGTGLDLSRTADADALYARLI